MFRPASSSGVRPGTSSGGRKVTDGFILRLRTSAATLRFNFPTSVGSTIHDLRQQIETQCGVAIQDQLLTRTRRPWFDALTTPIVEEFLDATQTLSEAGLQHGDMIFLESKAPTIATESTPIGVDAVDGRGSSPAAGSPNGDPPPRLIFRAIDLTDESETKSAIQDSSRDLRQRALSLLDTIRQESNAMTTSSSSSSTSHAATNFDELQRLISQLTLSSSSSTTNSNNDWTTTPIIPSASIDTTTVDATTTQQRRVDIDTNRSDTLEDIDPDVDTPRVEPIESSDTTNADRQIREEGSSSSRVSHSSSSDPAAGGVDSTATSASLAALTSEVAYWRGRYDRLRLKAEKMNTAGMSLKNLHDTTLMNHEKTLRQWKGRLQRREERIERNERIIAGWEEYDRSRGGTGILPFDPNEGYENRPMTAAAMTSRDLTSLQSAPNIRRPTPPTASISNNSSHPTDLDPSSTPLTNTPQPQSTSRRVRPESASRYRTRVVDGVPSASTGASVAPASEMRDRPTTSAGRTRTQPNSTDVGVIAPSDSSSSSSHLVDPESESRRYRASQSASLVAESRHAMRHIIDQGKQLHGSRAHLAATTSMRSGAGMGGSANNRDK